MPVKRFQTSLKNVKILVYSIQDSADEIEKGVSKAWVEDGRIIGIPQFVPNKIFPFY